MQPSVRSRGSSASVTTVPPAVGPEVGLRARPCGGIGLGLGLGFGLGLGLGLGF